MASVLERDTSTPSDTAGSERLSLTQATRFFHPRCHPATLTRWIQAGIRLPGGGRLKLRAIRCASKWWTSRAWINDFLEAQTAAFVERAVAPAARAPAERSRAADSANAELAGAGW